MKRFFTILAPCLVLITAPQARACAVCFGASDENTRVGIVSSILFLLGLIIVVLGMLAAGDSIDTIVEGYPWLERADVLACLAYARQVVAHERIEPLFSNTGS